MLSLSHSMLLCCFKLWTRRRSNVASLPLMSNTLSSSVRFRGHNEYIRVSVVHGDRVYLFFSNVRQLSRCPLLWNVATCAFLAAASALRTQHRIIYKLIIPVQLFFTSIASTNFQGAYGVLTRFIVNADNYFEENCVQFLIEVAYREVFHVHFIPASPQGAQSFIWLLICRYTDVLSRFCVTHISPETSHTMHRLQGSYSPLFLGLDAHAQRLYTLRHPYCSPSQPALQSQDQG